MSELISVIIPVYKVENYLRKCIESIINQTYNNLEIILIDDGSPDRSGAICDEYAAKDSRIRVIHKENEGVAMARNDGIAIAKGDYISFVDSDDWMDKRAYEKFYNKRKEYDADCVIGECRKVYEKKGKLRYGRIPKTNEECVSATDVMKRTLLLGSAAWNMLFKKSIFDTVRFPKGRINDDEAAALRAYAKCEKIALLSDITYYYRIRPNSIVTSSFSEKKLDVYYNSRDNYDFIMMVRPELDKCAEFKVCKALAYCYINIRKLRKTPNYEINKHRLKKDIQTYFGRAMKNPYMALWLKMAYILCLFI